MTDPKTIPEAWEKAVRELIDNNASWAAVADRVAAESLEQRKSSLIQRLKYKVYQLKHLRLRVVGEYDDDY